MVQHAVLALSVPPLSSIDGWPIVDPSVGARYSTVAAGIAESYTDQIQKLSD
jgi:hypothetical protein